jgi:hypothetical protein
MRGLVVVLILGIMVAAGSTVAAEPPPEAVASSTRAVRGQTALEASLAEGWRVADQRDTSEGVVYELVWGGGGD